ncbi:MAG: endo alpha-1,4 polygalactosaminidase [Pseudoruegeria sp.]
MSELVASGKTIVGYVSVGQSDDARPYWDTSWTEDGTDTGVLTDAAPSWLAEQADSFDAAIVEFWNPDWQALVIDQVTDLATRGYTGIFLDNMLSYYEVAALRGELGTEQSQLYAQEMMTFVGAIADAGKAVNPDFVVIPNGGSFIVGDAGYAQDSEEALAYYDAIDAVMAESFFGLATGVYEEAVLDVFQTVFAAQGIDVLALEYSTDTAAIDAFAAEAEARGFAASVSADFALNTLPAPLEDAPDPIVLTGTSGADELISGDGNDELSGLKGNDVLIGNDGDDTLSGGAGSDELFGGDGQDTLSGNRGADYLEGGTGSDLLYGGKGHDDLSGGQGDDDLHGGKGLDELHGGEGNDTLDGGNSHDYLEGGAGDDVLNGAKGNDELYGGTGSDQFVFSDNSGWDVIGDFDLANDVLVIEGLTLDDSYETENALVLAFDENTQVEIIGLQAGDVSQIEFTFV